MEIEKIKKYNELIARFMKYKSKKIKYTDFKILSFKIPFLVDIDNDGFIYSHMLKFNTSWDWLMPVIERIEFLDYDTIIFRNRVNEENNLSYGFHIKKYNTAYVEAIIKEWGDTKIETVYKGVIKFIKWYNKKNLSYK